MRRPGILLPAVLTVVLLPALAGTAPKKQDQVPPWPVALPSVEGERVTLPAPDQEATVLLYTSVDCPISNAYAPEVRRIHEAYAEKGVAFYRVYAIPGADRSEIKKHTEEYGYTFPAVVDEDQATVQRTGARVTPEAVVLDEDGEIRYRGRINNMYAGLGKRRRVITSHDLRDALDAVLNEEKIADARTKAFGCFIPLTFEDEKAQEKESES